MKHVLGRASRQRGARRPRPRAGRARRGRAVRASLDAVGAADRVRGSSGRGHALLPAARRGGRPASRAGRPGLRFVARSLLARSQLDPAVAAGQRRPGAAARRTPDPRRAARLRAGHHAPRVRPTDDRVGQRTRRSSAWTRRRRDPHGSRPPRRGGGGSAADRPSREVMSAPAFTVTPDRLGGEVMLEMLRRGIRHVPVVSPLGDVIGVLSDVDLLAAQTSDAVRAPARDRRCERPRAGAGGSVSACRPRSYPCTTRASPRARSARSSRSSPMPAPGRLVEMVIEELGEPPRPFAWVALGSHGRRELAPRSDADSAIAWEGDDQAIRIAGVHGGPRRTGGHGAGRDRVHGGRARRNVRTAPVPTLGRFVARVDPALHRAPGREEGAGADLARLRRPVRVQLPARPREFGRSCAQPTIAAACFG